MNKIILLAVTLLSYSASLAKADSPAVVPLSVLETYTFPAVEISGMAWRRNPENKRRELVLVSDRVPKIYIVDWSKRKTELAPREVDLVALGFKNDSVSGNSEWESVFSDESGRLFILRENPAQVIVVSADLKKIESKISLTVPSGAKDSADWKNVENSGAEGLFPLKNGHMLIVKEKDPLRVVEFAPKGKNAQGFEPALSLEKKGLFPVSQELQSAFTWKLSQQDERLFEDASGLNVDDNGVLYLLGDQKNLIGRIGSSLKTSAAELKIDRLWSIPSEVSKPEGMVIDEEGRPIISVDRKNLKKPNLFLLSPLK